ncbi:hypothetical protein Tco_0167898 [Tanacetum coccineum]
MLATSSPRSESIIFKRFWCRQAHLVDTDTESDPEEAPSEIEECQPLVPRAPLLMRSLRLLSHRTLGHHIIFLSFIGFHRTTIT